MTVQPFGVAVLALIIASYPATRANAQTASPLTAGMRVKVQTVGAHPAQGIVVSVGTSSFGFRPERRTDTVFVDYAQVRRIDVSQGRRHRVLRDAIYGGIAGLVVGGVIGAASHPNFPTPVVVIPPDSSGQSGCTIRDPESSEPDPATPIIKEREPTGADLERTARSAAVGAAIGALAGAVVGRFTTGEVWQKLPLHDDRLAVAVVPTYSDGPRLLLRIGIAMR